MVFFHHCHNWLWFFNYYSGCYSLWWIFKPSRHIKSRIYVLHKRNLIVACKSGFKKILIGNYYKKSIRNQLGFFSLMQLECTAELCVDKLTAKAHFQQHSAAWKVYSQDWAAESSTVWPTNVFGGVIWLLVPSLPLAGLYSACSFATRFWFTVTKYRAVYLILIMVLSGPFFS